MAEAQSSEKATVGPLCPLVSESRQSEVQGNDGTGASGSGRTEIPKASAFAVVTNVVQILGGLACAAILARFLGPGQKGAYDLYVASATLLSLALGFSLNAGIVYVVASEPVNFRRLRLAILALGMAVGAITLGLIAALRYYGLAANVVPSEFGGWGDSAVAGTVSLFMFSNCYRALMTGRRLFVQANYVDMLKQVFAVGGVLAAIMAAKGLGITLTHSVVLANMLVIGAVSFLYQVRVPQGKIITNNIGLKTALRYSLPSYLAVTSQYLNNRIDLFFVYHYWGGADVGIYQTAVLIGQSITMLPSAVQGILYPTIASKDRSRKEMLETIVRTHRLIFWLCAAIACAVVIAGHFVIPLIFGEKFRASATSLAILAPGCAIFVTANILAAYFAGIGRPSVNLINSLISAIVTVVLDALVVPKWGFLGASYVTVVSYMLCSVLSLTKFQKETGATLRELYVLSAGDVAFIVHSVRQGRKRLGNLFWDSEDR